MQNRVNFPKIGRKHTFTPLFNAKRTTKGEKRLPSKILFIYSTGSIQRKLRREMKLSVYLHNAGGCGGCKPQHLITKDRKLDVMVLAAGAPFTAVAAEEAIACGAKEILIIGAAGALNRKLNSSDIVLCNAAIRDEGTSHHYLRDSVYSYPDRKLSSDLATGMRHAGINFVQGRTWTIDAPYVETREEIENYRKKGILTVEMEASALFAVAKKRKIRAAAVFTISDLLGEEWSGFMSDYKDEGYKRLAKVAAIFKEL